MKLHKVLAILFSVLFLIPAAGAQVYKWKDKNGITHYSSAKPDAQATPANLPPIVREKKGPTSVTLSFSCTSHGGIDCNSGPDTDGSVICLDGFRDAIARFKFRCESTRLTALEIEKAPDHISVWIRNEKQVEAKDVDILLTLPSGESVKAQGPAVIPPSELAEFQFNNIDLEQIYTLAQIETSCGNCG